MNHGRVRVDFMNQFVRLVARNPIDVDRGARKRFVFLEILENAHETSHCTIHAGHLLGLSLRP